MGVFPRLKTYYPWIAERGASGALRGGGGDGRRHLTFFSLLRRPLGLPASLPPSPWPRGSCALSFPGVLLALRSPAHLLTYPSCAGFPSPSLQNSPQVSSALHLAFWSPCFLVRGGDRGHRCLPERMLCYQTPTRALAPSFPPLLPHLGSCPHSSLLTPSFPGPCLLCPPARSTFRFLLVGPSGEIILQDPGSSPARQILE